MPGTIKAVDTLSSAELEQLRRQVLAQYPHLGMPRAPAVPQASEDA
jgi:hypothetical protein